MSNVKGTAAKPSQALNLDVNQQRLFIKYYQSLGAKPATTVRFFDRSDYYSLHGEDALLAARLVFKSDASVKVMAPPAGDDDSTAPPCELPYVCLNRGNFEVLLRDLLLVRRHRVEVYTRGHASSNNNWKLEFKGSPGNLTAFESLLFDNADQITSGSAILGVFLRVEGARRSLGVAVVEQHEREIKLGELEDDDYHTELEALIVAIAPKECLLPRTDGEYTRVHLLLERNGVMTTVAPKRSDFNATDTAACVADLNRLLRFERGQQESAHTLREIGAQPLALAALGATIRYLGLLEDACNHGHFTVATQLDLRRFVHLDAAAVSALNLMPRAGGAQPSSAAYRWQSLLGVLDRCRTAQGHRTMAQWVRQPLRCRALIEERQNIVQALVEDSCTRAELHDNLMRKWPDVLALTKRLQRRRATLADLYRLYQCVGRVPAIVAALEAIRDATVRSAFCEPLRDSCADLALFRQMVEQVVDRDALRRNEYMVAPAFDEQLADAKAELTRLEEQIQEQRGRAANQLGLETVKLDYSSQHGWYMRLTLKEETAIRKHKVFQVLDAVKGGVRFTTERIAALNVDFAQAKKLYEDQSGSIVTEIVRVATGYLGSLSALNQHIAHLDCLLSFAVAACAAPLPYTRPRMHDEGTGQLQMNNVRHPCLELQEDVQYIANDVHFKRDDTHMYIITGPNMGGKSTYIRSIGCAVLMAHIGAFVPSSLADISIVDAILGRVGADDNQDKGLSTFMVEMIETAGIVRGATQSSLVFIDELGRGTSTYEGCGIAWSIAEHLARRTRCNTLFATHFQEIGDLAMAEPTVRNVHMEARAQGDEFTLLYRVRPGVVTKSFGLHVAKLARFPMALLARAQRTYEEFEDHVGKLDGYDEPEAVAVYERVQAEIAAVRVGDDASVEAFMERVREMTRQSKCAYFRDTFPGLFERVTTAEERS